MTDTVEWLRGRAEISDTLHEFADALDSQDWQRYAGLYADDGILELPWGEVVTKDRLVESTSHNLGRFHATQHISTNHRVSVDGDGATSSSYLIATHVFPPDQDRAHWVIGARYDCTFRRENGAWKFTHVTLSTIWHTGEAPPLG